MFDVLRFNADTPASRVGAALAHTPARRIALVFPPGHHTAIADTTALQAIAERARRARKQITIVGGDAYLRACAVAAGLAAATSIDDWRQARPVESTRRPSDARGAAAPRLALVAPAETAPVEPPCGLWDDSAIASCDAELPEYVVRLTAPRYKSSAECELEAPRATWTRSLPLTDEDAYLAAERASERSEEVISDAIVETSLQGCGAGLAH